MKESQSVVNTRQRGHASLGGARSGVSVLAGRVNQVRMDTRWSDEGRRQQVEQALGEGSFAIRRTMEDAKEAVRFELRVADQRLSGLREVSPEVLNDRRQALGPFLQRGFDDPEVVLNLYRDHFGEHAARRVLEEYAEYLVTALGAEGAQLAESWRALVEELAPQRPPEEQQALLDRAALFELEGYLDAGEALVNIDLAGLQDEGLSEEVMLRRPMLEAEINNYESTHGLVSSLPGAEQAPVG